MNNITSSSQHQTLLYQNPSQHTTSMKDIRSLKQAPTLLTQQNMKPTKKTISQKKSSS